MHRQDTQYTEHLGADYLSLPLGIALANGTTVTVIVEDVMLPRSQTIVLTNSRDNQTTATLQFLKGTLPCGEITVEGLTEKPKGAARIQVAIEADHEGETVVMVQEVGGTARKVANILNILNCTAEDVAAYEAEATIKQMSPTNEGDAIGELPE
jgi:molecular chaperone DnaK (HSP70)